MANGAWNIGQLYLIYKSPRYFLQSFRSNGLSVQEKKFKIDFQAAIFDFQSEQFFAIFDFQGTTILPMKFRVSGPFGSVKEV